MDLEFINENYLEEKNIAQNYREIYERVEYSWPKNVSYFKDEATLKNYFSDFFSLRRIEMTNGRVCSLFWSFDLSSKYLPEWG